MPLSPQDRATLSQAVRAARARLCTDRPPDAAYVAVMAAIDAVQSGAVAVPDWLDAALRAPQLRRCLAEPTAASWAHQSFYAPDLAALNARLEAGELLSAAQLARKTQLFTDPYMVDWLIDNTLGVIWQGMCQEHGWHDTATWAYRVPQVLPPDQLAGLPATLRELRILDPACGTGIFLLALLERLLELYRCEAAQREQPFELSDAVQHIVQHNLSGLDIDDTALAVAERALRRRAIALGAQPQYIQLTAMPAPLGALALQAGGYHLVIGNPPYLSTRLMSSTLQAALPPQLPDLYAAFLRHGLALCAPGGVCAMVTQRGWMFTAQFQSLRAHILGAHRPTVLGDLAEGAFAGISGAVVSVVMSVIWNLPPDDQITVVAAHQRGVAEKACALRDRRSIHTVRPSALSVVPGQPLLYWWSPSLLQRYQDAPQLGACAEIRQGMATGHNARFLRRPWEIDPTDLWLQRLDAPLTQPTRRFVPYIKGAAGREWIEDLSDVIDWDRGGLQIKLMHETRYGSYTKRIPSEDFFYRPAVCFTKIGARFSARTPRYRSIFDVAGSAVFPADIAEVLCLLNSQQAREMLQDLNPTVNFQVGDVRRLPLLPIASAALIHQRLCEAFAVHAAVTQTSPAFVGLGPSPWRWAQQWAQHAVDRPPGEQLPDWSPVSDAPTALDHLSVAVETTTRAAGCIFLAGAGGHDSLSEACAAPLQRAWHQHPQGPSLSDWLRRRFFPDDHLRRYESRPIVLPLSSARKTFVALVHLHRWTPQTLPDLLQRHLRPTLARLAQHPARGELLDFTAAVERLATRGPEGAEYAAPFQPVLSDGVVVNSAAIWPLLHPQWKAPRRWWRRGLPLDAPRSFAWSAMAKRYFPASVDRLCRQDASLSAAHGCLRRYHPDRAKRWGVAEE